MHRREVDVRGVAGRNRLDPTAPPLVDEARHGGGVDRDRHDDADAT